MVTTANDGFVKLWDVSKVRQGVPRVIHSVSFNGFHFWKKEWLLLRNTWISLIICGLRCQFPLFKQKLPVEAP